jgi:hydrogenase maturation factor HypF (carbamoyltransferase family)
MRVPLSWNGGYVAVSIISKKTDTLIYFIFSTHKIFTPTEKKINYQEDHYRDLIRRTHSFAEENIAARAKENLRALGAVYE